MNRDGEDPDASTDFEHARVAYFKEVLDVPLQETKSVLASPETDFRRPVTDC
jgi:acyl-CoA thioesterase FadM